LQLFADIIAAILNFLRPIVSPMGQFMVLWMDFVLQFFPVELLTYIILFAIIVVLGIIVNTIWPGDKPPKYIDTYRGKTRKKEEEEKVKEPKIIIKEKKGEQKVEKPLEEEIEHKKTKEVEETREIEEQLEAKEIKGGKIEEPPKAKVKPEKIDKKELKEEKEQVFEQEELKEIPIEKVEQAIAQEEEDEIESRVKAWLNQVKNYRESK
jgi:FtsZ-interacting cell division protein ZipA